MSAIQRLATGYCKLLFPHGQITQAEFAEYCLRPAVQLRQRVRDQLALLDPEYPRLRLGLTATLKAQFAEGAQLEQVIAANLARLGYEL